MTVKELLNEIDTYFEDYNCCYLGGRDLYFKEYEKANCKNAKQSYLITRSLLNQEAYLVEAEFSKHLYIVTKRSIDGPFGNKNKLRNDRIVDFKTIKYEFLSK